MCVHIVSERVLVNVCESECECVSVCVCVCESECASE